MNRASLRRNMPAPQYRAILVKKNQTANDIAKLLRIAELDSRKYVGKIIKFFEAKTRVESCKLVWYFLRNNITYNKEPASLQSAKTINRLMADGFGDCKHYSIFSVCILRALKIPCVFRLASFNYYDATPTHAYCVAFINGQEVCIDACIKNFDDECSYKYITDIKPLKK